MKKQIIALTALAGFALGATIAYAGSIPGSGIVGSKHDMNLLTTYGGTKDSIRSDTPGSRVCAFCHTPHHKLDSSDLDYNPLWSHTVSTGTYTPYGAKTITFDGNIAGDPLTGPSRLCMSCHDGVIAPDQHYGMNGTATGDHIQGNDFGQIAVGLNKDLSKTHPIGFDISGYPATDTSQGGGMTVLGGAGIRAKLHAPNNPKMGDGTKDFTVVGWNNANSGTKIFTCLSCHDVHNKNNVDNYFLYEKEDGSAICLMCHDK